MGSLEDADDCISAKAETISTVDKVKVVKRKKSAKKQQKLQYFMQFDTVPLRRLTELGLDVESQETLEEEDNEWNEVEESMVDEEYIVRSKRGGKAVLRSNASNKKQKIQKDKLTRLHDEHKKLKRTETIKTNCLHQKGNIEDRLLKNGIKRFGYSLYEKRTASKPITTTRNTHSHHYDDPLSVKRHELKKTNVPKEHAYLAQVVDLQHRELTPEDYELLLLLDNTVSAKTVDSQKLKSLHEVSVPVAGLTGETCSICMENYESEQRAKMLPCKHYFHSTCIDFWLANSSYKCPLDGLEVFPE